MLFRSGNWHAEFPYAIWHLPDPKQPGVRTAGYFSVVVPITEDSWEKISLGHLSTVLASVDASAGAYVKSTPLAAYESPLYLLAYAVVYVAENYVAENPNEFTLVRAGIEHLAFLIKTFSHNGQFNPKNIRVICESSGREFDRTLHGLGFSWIEPNGLRTRKGLIAWVRAYILKLFGQEDIVVVTSPAGFKLFQVKGFEQKRARRLWDIMNEIG